ncbi:unnamed protein product [Boreogadus saida]
MGAQDQDSWRLDYWEDDLRRRRRLVRNPLGSAHQGVTRRALEDYGYGFPPKKGDTESGLRGEGQVLDSGSGNV